MTYEFPYILFLEGFLNRCGGLLTKLLAHLSYHSAGQILGLVEMIPTSFLELPEPSSTSETVSRPPFKNLKFYAKVYRIRFITPTTPFCVGVVNRGACHCDLQRPFRTKKRKASGKPQEI